MIGIRSNHQRLIMIEIQRGEVTAGGGDKTIQYYARSDQQKHEKHPNDFDIVMENEH